MANAWWIFCLMIEWNRSGISYPNKYFKSIFSYWAHFVETYRQREEETQSEQERVCAFCSSFFYAWLKLSVLLMKTEHCHCTAAPVWLVSVGLCYESRSQFAAGHYLINSSQYTRLHFSSLATRHLDSKRKNVQRETSQGRWIDGFSKIVLYVHLL